MAEPQPIFFKDSARRVQCKMKVNKLQFIGLIGGLIGGRVCNPRQQQVLSIYLWSLCDYKQIIYNMLLPRVENPPPQLGK